MGQKTARIQGVDQLGNRIKFFMKERKMRYSDLAKAIGKSEETVKKMLSGTGLLQYVKLAHLAEVLGTTPNELLGFEPSANSDVLSVALQVSYEALGLDQAEAQELAAIVLQSAQDAPEFADDVPVEQAARILVQSNAKKFRH